MGRRIARNNGSMQKLGGMIRYYETMGFVWAVAADARGNARPKLHLAFGCCPQ